MFRLHHRSARSAARLGELATPHGVLPTPFFMPIATRGAVKTLSSFDLERLGSPILLANAYHLWLRPGLEVLRGFGGLHRFMDWRGALLTDSGGFQVFSLAKIRRLEEEGVHFQSHIDGAPLLLTPERCMEIQRAIGGDICMALDVCSPLPSSSEDLAQALALTTRWAKRSKQAFLASREEAINPEAQLFGIVQGGTDLTLRKRSAADLLAIGFDGYAIGGLSVGEPFDEACRVLEQLEPVLPSDHPRYFMGGGQPHEIVEYVRRGMDMFDCVLPTRNARHGLLYRFVHDDLSRPDFYETIHVTNETWRMCEIPLISDEGPGEVLDRGSINAELSRYTLGFLRHLFSIDEMLGYRLATLANLHFYLELLRRIREAVRADLL